jgi:hypothetical protein
MSHSQFHSISSLYLDMHGLIFERCIGDQGAGGKPLTTPTPHYRWQYYRRPGQTLTVPAARFLLPATLRWEPTIS